MKQLWNTFVAKNNVTKIFQACFVSLYFGLSRRWENACVYPLQNRVLTECRANLCWDRLGSILIQLPGTFNKVSSKIIFSLFLPSSFYHVPFYQDFLDVIFFDTWVSFFPWKLVLTLFYKDFELWWSFYETQLKSSEDSFIFLWAYRMETQWWTYHCLRGKQTFEKSGLEDS